jgi:sec-independent protein translocase protein TatC
MSDKDSTDSIPDNIKNQEESKETSPQAQMPLMRHLDELRTRILYSLVSIMIGFLVAFYFRELIFKIVLRPYGPDFNPIVLDVTERFFNYFKVSMAAGLVLASPVIIGQLLGFIMPALLPNEKRFVLPTIPVIVFLFALGVLFGYFLVLPVALGFLLNFGSDAIANQIRLDRSINFVTTTCLSCGLVFQLPVVVFLLSKVGLVNEDFLRRQRKISIVVIMILAAALTPTPDPFTMLLVATPMLLLYEISVYVARIAAPKKKQIDPDEVLVDDSD